MFLDFLQHTFYTLLFFLGILGMGLLLLRIIDYRSRTLALSLGIAYFTSLCLYTLCLVGGLFLFQAKLQSLVILSVLYFLVSWSVLLIFFRQSLISWVKNVFDTRQRAFLLIFLGTLGLSTGLFFLQVYHTAILDEWLHRPVVSSFVQNGVFPLINPSSPGLDYIHNYHYGTQVVGAALQVLFGLDVPISLDLFKMSVFVATFFLFYGLIQEWTRSRWMALAGAVLVLFCGSSFFLIDSFTANHLVSFDGFNLPAGQRWPINMPLSYILTGITWSNIPLTIAFGLLIEALFCQDVRKLSWGTNSIIAVLLVGFFLVSELFAVITSVGFVCALIYQFWRGETLSKTKVITGLVVFFGVSIFGVYFTGGIVGGMLTRVVEHPQIVWENVRAWTQGSKISGDGEAAVDFLSLKPFTSWGYSSEKRVLVPWNVPFYYVRTLLLEVFILGLWGYLLAIKRVKISQHPVLSFLILVGLTGPFFFTTVFGDLNFSKTTALSFVLLHLMGFYLLSQLEGKKTLLSTLFFLLLAFGSIAGLLMGPNIQWHWISSKGESMLCSQNPDCYKPEIKELFRQFEEQYPGLKRVAVDTSNTQKVVDLSNSYISREIKPLTMEEPSDTYGADYIFDASELCQKQDASTELLSEKYPIILVKGNYCIRIIKK